MPDDITVELDEIDTPTLNILDTPGSIRTHFQAVGTTLNPTTTSTTFAAAIPEMTTTLTPESALNWVRVAFDGRFANSNAGRFVSIAIFIDAVEQSGTERNDDSVAANAGITLTVERWFQLSVAAHTIEIRWRVESNTGTAIDNDRTLLVQQYNGP